MQHFVRSGALLGFPELVREYGENPTRILRQLGLGPSILYNPDLYLPYITLAEILELAAQRCADEDFGVILGHRQGLEAVGALGSAMCLQPSLPQALNMMQKNLDFHARGVRVDVEAGDEYIDMRMHFAFADQTHCEQLTTLSMALLCRGVAQLHRQSLPPVMMQLTIAPPAQHRNYTRHFGCEVEFQAPENRLRYPAELLRLNVDVETRLLQRFSQQWRGDWDRNTTVSLRLQVERAITALLPTGDCNLETVARIVDMHPRSLQQKLRADGCSFGQLLQNTRLRLACQYLRNSDIDLTTLAQNLGFAELAVFSRSFRKWTGKPPRQWRKQATAA